MDKSFLKLINWKKFAYVVIPVPIILSLITLANDKPTWWIVPTITLAWIFLLSSQAFLLSSQAYSDYIMNKKHTKKKLSLTETRKIKLKIINNYVGNNKGV